MRQYIAKPFIADEDRDNELAAADYCMKMQRVVAGAIEMYQLDKGCVLLAHITGGKTWDQNEPFKSHTDEKPAGVVCALIPDALFNTMVSGNYLQFKPGHAIGGGEDGLCMTTWGNGVFCLVHGQIEPVGDYGTPPRTQLELSGVTDKGILERASAEPPKGSDFWIRERRTVALRLGLPVMLLVGLVGGLLWRRLHR